MKQTIKSMKKMLSCVAVLGFIVGLCMLASCSGNDYPSSENTTSVKADLVVYGKIYTAERLRVGDGTSGMGSNVVEAFAVKDGKFVYVGDKMGADGTPTGFVREQAGT